MNTIGIDNNLDRARIRKLLLIGLIASVMTGIGDFLLGYAEEIETGSIAGSVMAGAVNLTDGQMIAGSLLGMFGIFLEGLSCFGIYRLIADAAPKYAHIYRAGIFGYIWLAPIGCHLNMGILNMVYKYLLPLDTATADLVADRLCWWFSQPIYVLLAVFWLPMIVIQFKAFAKGLTPYPIYAKWFNVILGAIPALIIAKLIGSDNPIGPAIGTTFLSCGNAFMFGGLLATLPGEERFEEFREKLAGVHQE